jgi:hypothetical protein
MRFTYSYDCADGSAFAPGALDAMAGQEVAITAFGKTSTATIVCAGVPLLSTTVIVTVDLPDDSAVARLILDTPNPGYPVAIGEREPDCKHPFPCRSGCGCYKNDGNETAPATSQGPSGRGD